ncbi:MAG TPA: hypothetical protein VL634_20745, partial [Mycobacterium sp.]|nr:hypothetical protein [Mycobacterium sp.]
GDIGCTQIQGDVGRLIRFGQWLNGDGFADFEHAFVYLGNGQIIEAEPGGAREAELDEYDSRTIVWLRCPDQYRQAVTESAEALEGKPYSFLDYLALAAHRFHLPIPGLRHYIDSTGHLICSQLADRAAELGGWVLFADGRWPGYVTPADLARLALDHADHRKVTDGINR